VGVQQMLDPLHGRLLALGELLSSSRRCVGGVYAHVGFLAVGDPPVFRRATDAALRRVGSTPLAEPTLARYGVEPAAVSFN
jgi:hypothetical protein